MISNVESLTLCIQTQYDLLKFLETERRLLQVLFLHLNIEDIKLCYYSSMDLKGLDLSWFPFKEPTGCLMSVAAHTSTT
jgi:hypothetical protein